MTTTEKKIHGHGDFIPGSVRVVDYNSYFNNILVRGSSAFGAKTTSGTPFVLSDLISAIEADENFSSTGVTLSANPMVIDICLIGFAPASDGVKDKDEKIVESEIAWFTADSTTPNGNAGPYPVYFSATNSDIAAGTTMMYWPIQALGSPLLHKVGEVCNPPSSHSIGTGPDDTGFNYAGLIRAIWNAVQNQVANLPDAPATLEAITNAIIYVHCDSGVNRTGAAVAGYLMHFGSNLSALDLPATNGVPYTLAQAQNAAARAAPSNDSPPGGVDLPVAQAYCNYIYTKQLDAGLSVACLPASSD